MSAYSNRVIADGASAYWRLDEASGLTALDSVGSAHGTISGGVTLNQAGALLDGATAMRFNGASGNISVPVGSYSAIGTGPLTVECWFWHDGAASDHHLCDSGQHGTAAVAGFDIVRTDLNLVFRITNGSAIWTVATPAPPTTGRWHHVAGVVRRGTPDRLEIYLDGVQITANSVPAQGWNLTTALPFTIAKPNNYSGNYWDGLIDEVAIYQTALTPQQIAAHYALSKHAEGSYASRVLTDGASAYWRLGEASGTVAVDELGAANGTISGGVTLKQPGALADGNTAMLFDGTTGKVLVPTGAYQIFATGPLTLECWCRVLGTPSGTAVVVDMKLDGTANAGPWLYVDATTFSFVVYNTAGGSGTAVYAGVAAAVADGQWRHVVGVLSRGPDELRLYVNGIQQSGVGVFPAGTNVTSVDGVGIATHTGGNSLFFNGSIDDVAIYKTALTPAQIAAHYAARTSMDTLSSAYLGVPGWLLSEDFMANRYNVWRPVTPSDTVDFAALTDGLLVGGAGNVAAVMESGQAVVLALPAGAWVPIAARRINATGTTATGLVALYGR